MTLPGRKKTGPDCPYPQRSPVASKFGLTCSGMLTAHCHQRASHSPRLAPAHGSSGGRISSAAATGAVAPVSATVSGVASTLVSAPVSEVVAPLDWATARPASIDADITAAIGMRARLTDMVPPRCAGSTDENPAATATVPLRRVSRRLARSHLVVVCQGAHSARSGASTSTRPVVVNLRRAW